MGDGRLPKLKTKIEVPQSGTMSTLFSQTRRLRQPDCCDLAATMVVANATRIAFPATSGGNKMNLKKSFFSLLIGGALAACGGGGGTDAVVNTAEGYWSGTASTGTIASIAILENGDAWGIYASGSTIYGALNGTASGNGTVFSASGKDFNFTSGTVAPGSFTGTVVQKSVINATSNTGSTVSLRY